MPERKTVTKNQLVNRIADKTSVHQVNARDVIQGFLDEIIEELSKGNRLEFRGFGIFKPKTKAPRRARNPRTGEPIDVPAKSTVKFKAGLLMRKRIQPGGNDHEIKDDQAQG